MGEKIRQLPLADDQRGALIMVVLDWLENDKEETHVVHQEILTVYHDLIKL